MARLFHHVLVQEQAISADGVQTFDLGVNPVSFLLLRLMPLNDTGTLANFQSYLGICGALNRVTIAFQGEAVVSMSGRDLAALAYFRYGVVPSQATHAETNDIKRHVVLPIFMGKFPYDERSCFPATRRGQLTLECDFDIADTGYNTMRFAVDSVELIGANPSEFEKKVQVAVTNAATGDTDIDLPIGNRIRGVLVFGTTAYSGAAPAPSWGRVQFLVNQQQFGYAGIDFEVAHMLNTVLGRQPAQMDERAYLVDATQADAEEKTHTGPIDIHAGGWHNYGWLDLDPTRNDAYSIDTRGASRVHLRSDVETADAVRAIAVEGVKV